jgi:hypothetical protein
MRLGILRNPASTGNHRRSAPALPPGTTMVETSTAADTRTALELLRDRGAEAIVIDGGDGTVRSAVVHLWAVFGAKPPTLAILANGNTNLIGRKVGALRTRSGLGQLADMTVAEAAARSRASPVLRIDFANGRPCERGFVAGWGAYAEATRIATHDMKARSNVQVIGAVLAVLRRNYAGASGGTLRRGVSCDLVIDGRRIAAGRRFGGIVTTLPRPLIWPLDPFWGRGDGPIRWLDIAAPPRRLALAAPLVAIGRPMAWMGRAGYRSGRSKRVELTLDGDIIIDGERFPGGGGGIITASETVRFIRC